MWVIENESADPFQGEWRLRGKVADPADRWAIDGSVFEHRGRRYFVWSGWPGAENGVQNIYIAPMSNPYTISGPRTSSMREFPAPAEISSRAVPASSRAASSAGGVRRVASMRSVGTSVRRTVNTRSQRAVR